MCSSTRGRCHTRHRISSNDGRSIRNSTGRHGAHLPRPKRLRAMEAARLIKSKNPHSMVEVKDLQSGDVTAVALRPG
jgi:hypothetical protein